MHSPLIKKSLASPLLIIILKVIHFMKQDYKKYNWHSNKNTDGLVNRFASNMVILNEAAWIG